MRFGKILSILLVLVMCLSLLPAALASGEGPAEAAPDPTDVSESDDSATDPAGEGPIWDLSDDGVLTIIGDGELTAPYAWADSAAQVRELVIGEGITGIGPSAFFGYTALESVTLPESLTTIGRDAFARCDLLRRINIPVSVTEIGIAAFSGCSSLETVEYTGTDEQWHAIDFLGVEHFLLLAHDGETSYSVGTISWRLTKDGDLTIAQEGTYSYYDKWWSDANIAGHFRSVTVEEGVSSLYRGAFFEFENVTRIELPHSLQAMADRLFEDCRSLTDIVYHGTEAEWAELIGSRSNDDLAGVTVYCLASGEDSTPADAAALLAADSPFEAARLLRQLTGLGSPAAPDGPAGPGDQDKLSLAEGLIGSLTGELFAVIGPPLDAAYSESCLVLGAEDGLLYYDGFIVETIRYEGGSEKVFDVYEN